MLEAVLFDMGNTLLDYHAGPSSDEDKDYRGLVKMSERLLSWDHAVAVQDLHARFYLPWLELFPSRKQQPKEFDLIESLRLAVPVEALNQEQIKTLILDFHIPSLQEAVTDSGALESLAHLRAADVKIGMISNTAVPGYCHDETLEHLGLLSLIDFRLYSYDEGIRKPSPELFIRAMRLADSTPDTTVMVGDSLELDLLPASQLGMRVVQYQSPRTGKTTDFGSLGGRNIGKASSIPMAVDFLRPLLSREG